jgi:alpha-beta hydrolase superfamily lysophospholipase
MSAQNEEFYLDGADHKKIFVEMHKPAEYDKVIIVFHGICEHSGRYANFVRYFLKRRTAVYLTNHKGHGKSEGDRGDIETFDHFVQDGLMVIKFVEDREEKPKFLFGHSMGGLISATTYLKNKDKFKNISGIMLSSPAFKAANLPDNFENAAIVLTELIKHFSLPSDLAPGMFINDPESLKSYVKDELVVKKLRPRILREILTAMIYCHEHIEEVVKPILLLIAGKDKIIDPSGTFNHYYRMKSKRKRKHVYQKSYHELANDLYRTQVFGDIDTWTNEVIIPESSLSKLIGVLKGIIHPFRVKKHL